MAINPSLKRVKELSKKLKEAETSPTSSVSWPSSGSHRGVDITYTTGSSSLGTHLHLGKKDNPRDELGRWIRNEDLVDSLDVAREEGRKEALRKVWDMLPNPGEIATLVNNGEAIGLTKLAKSSDEVNRPKILVRKDYLFPDKVAEETPTIVSKAIDELEIGWYQDSEAELYYYEGEKHWKETTLAKSKQLTEEAILGKLEYIG